MVFLKVLGKKNLKNELFILYKIHQGYLEKKNILKINTSYISNRQKNIVLFLKKLNFINFFYINDKYNIYVKNHRIKKFKTTNYNKIFLKYFENKPIYIF